MQYIEQALLRSTIGGPPPLVERKKIIKHAKVRHEIDLYVELKRAHGYGGVYIFECKNWKGKVGKNDIIAFSYKIQVSGAQRGFFVGTRFTKDAIEQAALDKRIYLLNAKALEFEIGREQTFFHFLVNRIELMNLDFFARDVEAAPRLDMATAVVLLDAEPLDVRQYAEAWAREATDRRLASFPGHEEGEFPMVAEEKREFEAGRLVIDNVDYATAKLTVDFTVEVKYPRVIARVEVDGRGAGVKLEPAERRGVGEFRTWLTSAPDGGTSETPPT